MDKKEEFDQRKVLIKEEIDKKKKSFKDLKVKVQEIQIKEVIKRRTMLLTSRTRRKWNIRITQYFPIGPISLCRVPIVTYDTTATYIDKIEKQIGGLDYIEDLLNESRSLVDQIKKEGLLPKDKIDDLVGVIYEFQDQLDDIRKDFHGILEQDREKQKIKEK